MLVASHVTPQSLLHCLFQYLGVFRAYLVDLLFLCFAWLLSFSILVFPFSCVGAEVCELRVQFCFQVYFLFLNSFLEILLMCFSNFPCSCFILSFV